MKKNNMVIYLILVTLCEMVLVILPVSDDIWNKIIACSTLLVTAILGFMTYLQTKHELRLGELDKIPFIKIMDITKENNVLQEGIEFQDYKISNYLQHDRDYFKPEYRAGMYLVVKDNEKKMKTSYTILTRIQNVTPIPLSRVQVYGIYKNQFIKSIDRFLIENLFDKKLKEYEEVEKQYQNIFGEREFQIAGNEKKNIYLEFRTDYDPKEPITMELTMELTIIFVCETVYSDTYYQETSLKLYLNQKGPGVHVYRILYDKSHVYSAEEYLHHVAREKYDEKLKNDLQKLL